MRGFIAGSVLAGLSSIASVLGECDAMNSVQMHESMGAGVGMNGMVDMSGPLSMSSADVMASWTKIPGSLMMVTADSEYLWGVNRGNNIYKKKRVFGAEWKQVPGALIWVSSYGTRFNGETWGVNKNGNIYKCVHPCNGNWVQIKGILKQISVGIADIWGVNFANEIYKCNKPCNGEWKQIGGYLTHVSSGMDEVWGANSSNQIYRCKLPCDGGNWKEVPGRLKSVEISPTDGTVVGVNTSGNIFKFHRGNGQFFQINGSLDQVFAANDYVLFGVNSMSEIFSGEMYRTHRMDMPPAGGFTDSRNSYYTPGGDSFVNNALAYGSTRYHKWCST